MAAVVEGFIGESSMGYEQPIQEESSIMAPTSVSWTWWRPWTGGEAQRNFEPWKKMVEERSGSFPAGMRWFLLNKLFQMRPAEMARLEGVKNPSAVRGLIIRVSDQLSCGESLLQNDPGLSGKNGREQPLWRLR